MLFAANFAVEQDVIAAAITTALLMLYLYASDQWRSQPRTLGVPKALGRAKMFGFRQITLFSFEKCLSKHKVTIFSKNFWGEWPLSPLPGYAYASDEQHHTLNQSRAATALRH